MIKRYSLLTRILIFSTISLIGVIGTTGCAAMVDTEYAEFDSGNNNTGTGNNNTGAYSVNKNLQGKWFRLDTNRYFYLKSSTDKEIELVENNLIKINNSSPPYYAVRHGSKNGIIRGKISQLNPSSGSAKLSSERILYRGLSGIGNIGVIISDLNNPENIITTNSDPDGNFEATDLTSGEYTVSVNDNGLTSVTNIDVIQETDVGILTPVEGSSWNFKVHATTFSKNYSSYSTEENFVYGDSDTYAAQIRIKNIGLADALAVSYELSVDDPLISITSGNLTGIVGTIEPNVEKIIDISIQPKFFSSLGYNEIYKDVKINVKVKDVYNDIWQDYVILRVYRRKMAINIKTLENSVHGFIIFPDHSLKRISTSSKQFLVPFRSDSQYKIILSNSSALNETTYSLGVDTGYSSEMTTFSDASIFEPNNTETNAKIIAINNNITAYLHKGDIDYYILDMSDVNETKEPVDLKYNSHKVYDETSYSANGNNDGKISAGEVVRLNVSIKNIGASTAKGVKSVLSTDDPYLTIDSSWNNSEPDSDSYEYYGCSGNGKIGDITSGSIKDNDGCYSSSSTFERPAKGDYLITVAGGTPSNHTATLTLTMTDEFNNQWTDTFTVTVE